MADMEFARRSNSGSGDLLVASLHEPLCGIIRPMHMTPQTVAALIKALIGTPSTSSSQDLLTRT
ncbi:MAG: hypothetical protein VX057_04115, partial [Candidatus Thermoplasmatota archaeon]|nr:hypothetical protein [Candidatus Thermoplasmatota archaeon]